MNILFTNYVVHKLEPRLIFGTFGKKGRNFTGRICVFHRGGGLKRGFRSLDFIRRVNSFGLVVKIFKDFHYSAFLGLIHYPAGFLSYILLAAGIESGDTIYSGPSVLNNSCFNEGSAIKLINMNNFLNIHCIETKPFKGAKVARAAGSTAVLVHKSNGFVFIKLTSGWIIKVSDQCTAVIGHCSNILHSTRKWTKAGFQRIKGIRPTTRGVAMNPCDHPHGGGNGKSSPPSSPVTPWGKFTKGTRTKVKKYQLKKRFSFKEGFKLK